MLKITYGLLCLCYLAAGTGLFYKFVHIFQLNGYKHDVQRRWLRDNIEGHMLRTVWVLAAPLLARRFGAAGLLSSAGLFLLALGVNFPRKGIKPLVVTARVKRLLAAFLCLLALPAILGALAPDAESYGAMLCAFCLAGAPWLLSAADSLNRPLEQAINRRYIREAERILRGQPELTVVGVTGSYGKTSVKFFLEKLLAVRYNVLVTPSNYNTTLGVVRTVRENLRATHEVFVCEMGARNPGDIQEICALVKPRFGVITAIGPQHLESFGSIANVVKTKFELADALPADGVLFRNLDDEEIRNRKVSVPTVDYGLIRGDYRAENIEVFEKGSRFTLRGVEFTTGLIGKHNVLNICAAIAAANTLGIPLDKLVQPVKRLEAVPHRLQLLGGGDRLVIDDAYNANPAGAAAALEALAAFSGLRVLVTPGMVELGEKQEALNRAFGRQAAACCDRAVLVGRANVESIRAGLLEAGFPPEHIRVAPAVGEAVAMADAFPAQGRRVILLENDLPDNY